MFTAIAITCLAAQFMLGSVTAVPTTPRDVSSNDWKFSHGWDGVVSSPGSIGTPLNGTANAPKPLTADTVGGIFICEDAGFGGICGFAVQPLNTCIVLGSDWNNKISSLGPDPGTLVVAYDESNCAGTNIAFVNPGTGDLVGLGWNDRISSFKASATT